MIIAEHIIDNDPTLKITNTDQLARGLGCPYMLVIESPYDGEYVAVRWLRKLPKSVKRCYWIVRF